MVDVTLVIQNLIPRVALLGIPLSVLLLVLLVLTFTARSSIVSAVHRFVKEHALWFGLAAALLATLGSLLYSEVVGFAPCPLCWYQRIFMYPQVLLFGVGLLARTRDTFKYALSLSLPGFGIAIYHYIVQILNITTNCVAPGGRELDAAAGECSTRYAFEFGFLTIPFMAAIAFSIIIFASLLGLRKDVSRRDR